MSNSKNPELHVYEEERDDFIDVGVGFGVMFGILFVMAVVATIIKMVQG